MGIKDQIHETDEYQARTAEKAGQAPGGQAATATAASAGMAGQGQTVASALGPVTDLEKSDVEFWMQVAQVVLLYLILRELQRGGAR